MQLGEEVPEDLSVCPFVVYDRVIGIRSDHIEVKKGTHHLFYACMVIPCHTIESAVLKGSEALPFPL